jgi:hypothetical protein
MAVLACSLMAISTEAAITNGLVGHWTFDESNGNTVADSAGTNVGAVYNADSASPQWGAGMVGNALTFRGPANGADYVLVPDYPKPTGKMTISAWVWADAAPTWACIAANWGGTQAGQFLFALWSGHLSPFI